MANFIFSNENYNLLRRLIWWNLLLGKVQNPVTSTPQVTLTKLEQAAAQFTPNCDVYRQSLFQ